jgi:hypothetical protein
LVRAELECMVIPSCLLCVVVYNFSPDGRFTLGG